MNRIEEEFWNFSVKGCLSQSSKTARFWVPLVRTLQHRGYVYGRSEFRNHSRPIR